MNQPHHTTVVMPEKCLQRECSDLLKQLLQLICGGMAKSYMDSVTHAAVTIITTPSVHVPWHLTNSELFCSYGDI